VRAASGSVPFADRLLDEVETVAQIGSYSLDIPSGCWVSSKGLDAIFGIDAAFERSIDGWTSLIHPSDREAMAAYFADEVLGRGRPFNRQYRIVRADTGEERCVHGRGTLTLDDSGRAVRMLGTIADVTQQVAVAEERAQLEAGLRRSERNLAEAQRIAHIGSWERDLATGALAWSDESHRLVGIEPGTFPGTLEAFLPFVHPDDRGKAGPSLAELEAGGHRAVDYRIVRADGAVRVLHEEAEVIRDATGAPVRYVGSTQDITERVAAEEERARLEEGLRASRRSLAEAQRVARLGSWEWDLGTDALQISDETHRIYGLEPGTFGGTNAAFHALVHPDDLARVLEADRRALEEGTTYDFDYRLVRPDGVVRAIHDVGEVIRDEIGHPVRVVGTTQDITEQLAADLERSRLVTAVEQVGEPVLIVDPSGCITYVNRAFERVTGFARAEVLGGSPYSPREGDPVDPAIEEMWRELRAGRQWSGHVTPRRRDGSPYDVDMLASPVRDDEGRVVSFVFAGRDITRERILEAQLRQAQKMEAIGQLAGGIAHDFNNVLTAIRGYGEMARDPAASEDERRADLDEVIANTDRAAELTRGLLAFGRRSVLRPQVLDSAAVVDGIVPLLRRLIGEHIELRTVLAPESPAVRVDRSQLEQVIVNLAVNARDAMPGGGVLTIATGAVEFDEADAALIPEATPGPYVEITVADTGAGMDEATRAHIFEPFFTTKPTGEGTGLGLATVHGIVHQSGGTIAVTSAPGQGTTFRILLPVVEAARDEATLSGTTASAAAGGSATILLVEDEAAVRELIRRALAAHGYTVLEAPDGGAALRLVGAHQRPIDLLLTDVVMPGLAGPDLARLVSGMQPATRVLYVSGYVPSAGDPAALDPSLYLAKPFTTEALLRKVRETLDAPA
jgi:PAS domain S-box-containing protein